MRCELGGFVCCTNDLSILKQGSNVMGGLYSGGCCAGGEKVGGTSKESDAIAPCARVRCEGGDGSVRGRRRRRGEQPAQGRDAHDEGVVCCTVDIRM